LDLKIDKWFNSFNIVAKTISIRHRFVVNTYYLIYGRDARFYNTDPYLGTLNDPRNIEGRKTL